MMDTSLELSLRVMALTCTALLFGQLALRTGVRRSAVLLLSLACMAGYLTCSAPGQVCTALPWAWPVLALALVFPFALWMQGRQVLQDTRHVPAVAWLGLATLLMAGTLATWPMLNDEARRWAFHGLKLTGFLFLGHALWGAWRFGAADLIESRRRVRRCLLAASLLYAVAVMAVELRLAGQPASAGLVLLNLLGLCAILLALALYLLSPAPNSIAFLLGQGGKKPPAAVMASAAPTTAAPASDMQQALLGKLQALMQDQHLYRDAELSVTRLAQQLRAPEYIVRRLIHERLSHRNFASFVNDYRLQEVATHLRDESKDRRPILTLALEAGFGSIGPFNRSFKERYGVTPTDYRNARGCAQG
ncbi:MAG: helix-turn-helix domain-containing protein [Polaromonas sp.]